MGYERFNAPGRTDQATSQPLQIFAAATIPVVGQFAELRATGLIDPFGDTWDSSGVFDADGLSSLIRSITTHTDTADELSLILNPISPATFSGPLNQMTTTSVLSDPIIRLRRWLPIVIRPAEPGYIPQNGPAHTLSERVLTTLAARMWPEPTMVMGPDSISLLFRVDLPIDDGGLTELTIEALADRFDNSLATIDRTASDPAYALSIAKRPPTNWLTGLQSEIRDTAWFKLPQRTDLVTAEKLRQMASLSGELPRPCDLDDRLAAWAKSDSVSTYPVLFNARRAIASMPDNGTKDHAASAAIRRLIDLGLTFGEVLLLVCEWNQKRMVKWTEKELLLLVNEGFCDRGNQAVAVAEPGTPASGPVGSGSLPSSRPRAKQIHRGRAKKASGQTSKAKKAKSRGRQR